MEVYLVLLSVTMSQLLGAGSAATPACGRVRTLGGASARIVGGTTAGQGQFPWMAMLIRNGRHFCGGSIIDEWHILTAAHCFKDVYTAFRGEDLTADNGTLMVFIETAGLEVIAGKHQYDTNRTYPMEQRVPVKAGVRHVSYQLAPGLLANDIALLRLERALTFNDTVSSICLPNVTSPIPREGIVAGWGLTNGTAETLPTVLKMLKASVFSRENCTSFANSTMPADRRKYGVDLEEDLADKVICLVNTTSDGDEICYGDSGGPLFSLAEGGNYYQQWGVVSWSYGKCPALRNSPQVFTLVPAFLPWIQQAKLELDSLCANYTCLLGICQEWQKTVQCVCYNGTVSRNCTNCEHKLQEPEGTFTSFNYPESYLKNIECLWTIEGGPGMKVELYFWDFDLLSDDSCSHDYVLIYKGNSPASATILGKYCGSGRPEPIRVVNASLSIYFFRNVFYWGRGFQAAYRLSKATDADKTSPPCGVVRTSSGASPRIINGRPAMKGQFPWMVMLTEKGHAICGGTIIDAWHVITAAHCLEKLPIMDFIHCESEAACEYVQTPDVSSIEVIAGKQEYDPTQPFPGEQRRKVVVGRLHEQYKMAPGFVANDIAVLRLDKPLVFNHNVSPICLPSASSTVPQVCTVAGWGLTNGITPTLPAQLMTITTSAFNREDCMKLPDDGRYDLSGQVADNTMCLVNVTHGGVHICMGDSGGPVFCLAPGGSSYQLMGVVSWVYEKCRAAPGVPAIMTFVPPFLPWLEYAQIVLNWIQGSDCARDPCDAGFCFSEGEEHTCVCLPEFSGPQCDKCGTELSGPEGGFTSFNYPEDYLNDMDCQWTIQGTTGQTIDLFFLDMDIEDSPNCTLDYVEIRESDMSGKSLGRFCGLILPPPIRVLDKSIWVHFVSNIGFRRRGFKAIYEVTEKPQATSLPPCGVVRTPRGPSARIIGGSPAMEGQFPWMVMLRYKGVHFCGGAIIDPLHVVTAAHCFPIFKTFFVLQGQKADNATTYIEYMDIEDLEVVAGKHQFNAGSEWEQERFAVAAIRHQQYDEAAGETSNDIAIIRLDHPLLFNNWVSHICLPTVSSTLPPECTVAGWGFTNGDNQTDPTELLMFTSSAFSRDDCLSLQTVMSPADGYDKDLSADLAKGTMCIANVTHGGEDSCQGDSGGPAFCLERGGQFYELMGVVSWGYACDAFPAVPGIYTFVPHFLPWVNQTIKDLDSICAFRPCGYGVCRAMEGDFECVCPEGFSGSDCDKCVSVLTKPAGEFKSFNYPGLYPNSMNCQWFVEADRGMHVQLFFHDFDLDTNCSLDYVEVYEDDFKGRELTVTYRLTGHEMDPERRIEHTDGVWKF